jgi:AbrB family looped-hinge helix DNA binding protein
MKSTVSSKGQITLPAKVRGALGLTSGTPVQFELTRGGVLLRKGGRGAHPVDELFGRLRLPKSVDALLDEMRRPRRRGHVPAGARLAQKRDEDRGRYRASFKELKVIDPSCA